VAGGKLCHWEKASINMTRYAMALNFLAVTVLLTARVAKYILLGLCKAEEFVLFKKSGCAVAVCDLSGNGNLRVRGCICEFYLFWGLAKENINVNKKVQLDATVCRHLFTAKSLYMFRVSQHPSSGALKHPKHVE